jgi:peptidoglycan/xylan/chitin deacetylase (PgdA/CDA1 family)
VVSPTAVKRRAKIAMSCAVYAAAVATLLVRRAVGRPARHKFVILYYHAVAAECRANFARQLDMLISRYNVVSADHQGPDAAGGWSVAITFDDAFQSVLDNAIPELVARRMPATIFVPAGVLGRQPAWDMEDGCADRGEIVASAEALRAVASDLVQLGAHSLTHPHLLRISPEERRREIEGCRRQMREIFYTDAVVFAFPYGEYDASVIEQCREAGYERVYSCIPGILDPAAAEFVRGRILVEASDGPLEFYLKILGAYSWVGYYSRIKQSLSLRRLIRIAAIPGIATLPENRQSR